MKPILGILPAAQRAFWEEAQSIPQNFVLYGGTALAMRLGHRQSIDFDFFSSSPLNLEELQLPFLRDAEVLQREPNTATLRVDRGGSVIVSFFGNLSFGQLESPAIAEPGGVKIASLADLMATKLKTVVQRSEAKDYVDIAAILETGMSLATGLAGANALFGPSFNSALPLKALVYFGDGDLETLPSGVREQLLAAVMNTRELPTMGRHGPIIGALDG
ncbi:MAG: nucleotidyl transferase AbiEii/AbiGii toxin family protein [Chthoniobacterales bacterium]